MMSKFKQYFQARNAAEKKAVINIMGDIGSWWDGNTDIEIAAQLRLLGDVEEIDVFINTYGGLLSHGLSIYNQFRRFDAKINTFVDGIAASAGGIIFMAGDKRVMPVGTTIMVHNPISGAYGFAGDLRKAADALDVQRESLVSLFADRTSQAVERISELLDGETFLTPEQARELGFATEISGSAVTGTVDDENLVINGMQIPRERFVSMPQNILNSFKPAPKENAAAQNSIAGDAGNKSQEQSPMDIETLKTKHPDIYNAVKTEAVNSASDGILKAERERIGAINAAAMPAFASMAAEAINSGMSAGEFALNQLKAIKEKDSDGAQNYLNGRKNSSDSINEIDPDSNTGVKGGEAEAAKEADFISAAQNTFKGPQAK